jgi:hypothetical protein
VRARIPVCSTTRVKSEIVFPLMVDGSGSRGCRIFGRLRPDRIVRKRGAIRSFKRSPQRQANRPTGWAWNNFGHCQSRVLKSPRRLGDRRQPLPLERSSRMISLLPAGLYPVRDAVLHADGV